MREDQGDLYRRRSDPSVRPHHAVITALAEVRETDVADLDLNLYEYIEPEAFDMLLLHRRERDVSITFSVSDNTITTWIDDEHHTIVEVKGELV